MQSDFKQENLIYSACIVFIPAGAEYTEGDSGAGGGCCKHPPSPPPWELFTLFKTENVA